MGLRRAGQKKIGIGVLMTAIWHSLIVVPWAPFQSSVCSMNGVPPEIKAEARRQRRERPESAREARNVAPA